MEQGGKAMIMRGQGARMVGTARISNGLRYPDQPLLNDRLKGRSTRIEKPQINRGTLPSHRDPWLHIIPVSTYQILMQ